MQLQTSVLTRIAFWTLSSLSIAFSPWSTAQGEQHWLLSSPPTTLSSEQITQYCKNYRVATLSDSSLSAIKPPCPENNIFILQTKSNTISGFSCQDWLSLDIASAQTYKRLSKQIPLVIGSDKKVKENKVVVERHQASILTGKSEMDLIRNLYQMLDELTFTNEIGYAVLVTDDTFFSPKGLLAISTYLNRKGIPVFGRGSSIHGEDKGQVSYYELDKTNCINYVVKLQDDLWDKTNPTPLSCLSQKTNERAMRFHNL